MFKMSLTISLFFSLQLLIVDTTSKNWILIPLCHNFKTFSQMVWHFFLWEVRVCDPSLEPPQDFNTVSKTKKVAKATLLDFSKGRELFFHYLLGHWMWELSAVFNRSVMKPPVEGPMGRLLTHQHIWAYRHTNMLLEMMSQSPRCPTSKLFEFS